MVKYNTKIRYGNTVEVFHPLFLALGAVAGETAVVKEGTVLKFAKQASGGTVEDGEITFSDGGKRFRGRIRTGTGGNVDYWGWLDGTHESAD